MPVDKRGRFCPDFDNLREEKIVGKINDVMTYLRRTNKRGMIEVVRGDQ